MTTQTSVDTSNDFLKWAIVNHINSFLQEKASQSDAISLNDLYQVLERPPETKMGDFAFPCFRLAKILRMKPQMIATELAETFKDKAVIWVDRVEVVGAFLNFFVDHAEFAKTLLPKITNGDLFNDFRKNSGNSNTNVMIEYSQPNTHKVFHVGHMRNVALGDSLRRLFEYCGYNVVPVNYIGDEGTHIAKCIWYIQKNSVEVPAENRGEWLGDMYSKATFMLEEASEDELKVYNQEISQVLRDIESKEGPTYKFWQESVKWSIDVFNDIYNWLSARFDYVFTESEVSKDSQAIVDQYLKEKVFVESDGAIGCDLKEHKCGFVLLRKRDGNTLYATKDLALAKLKFEKYKVDRSIYVVGSEQQLHFKQVFKTLELMGFEQAKKCYHLSYGLVVLPEGKMSSRKGNVITFSKLKDSLSKELTNYLKKYEGAWTKEELEETNRKLCVGAIKYGMLCSDANKDIVFDLKNWTSFEGDTGPYLMYSYARTQSILRKAKDQGFLPDLGSVSSLAAEEEHDLMRYLYDFNSVVSSACQSYKPSILTHFLFDMCKAFNRFHSHVPVLKADTVEQKVGRLALIQCFCEVLKQGLDLIGIVPPEKM